MNLKLRITPVVLAFGVLSLVAAAQANTPKIGIPQPMTGPNTQYGDQIQAGALTAIDALNEKGGIKGMRIEPLLIVDGCEPRQAVPAVNRVVNSGATSPLVADTIKPHYFFRTIGRDDQQGPFAADYIAKQLKPQKVAILHDKQTYGSGLATQVQKSLQKDGVNVVQP